MTPLRLICLFATLLWVAATPATRPSAARPNAARKLVADKSRSSLTYTMRHPLHNWEGVSREVNCAVLYDDASQRIGSVAVSVPVSSFDSRNQNRDSHALEVLDALKFPNVQFVSRKIDVAPDGSLNVVGNLTFHGVTKPVQFTATRQLTNGRMTVEGGFDLKLSDHNVERPSLMALKTEDEVKMKFVVSFGL